MVEHERNSDAVAADAGATAADRGIDQVRVRIGEVVDSEPFLTLTMPPPTSRAVREQLPRGPTC